MNVREFELNTAGKVANKVGRQWERIEIEDLYSHLVLWLYTHSKRVQAGDRETYPGRLWSELKREAIRYCAKETAQNIGQPINLDRVYTINRVRRALPFIFEAPPINQAVVDPSNGRTVSHHTNGDAHDLLIDVYEAFRRLTSAQRELIRLKYRDGLSWAEIAEITASTVGATKMRMDRAIKTLVSELGTENEPHF